MDPLPEVVLEKISHRGKPCIAVRFEKNFNLIREIKKIPGLKFSSTHRCWYIEDQGNALRSLLEKITGHARVDDSALRKSPFSSLTRHHGSVPS